MNYIEAEVALVKDILQILFFITTGVLAILTYRSAKKTVLQPIKTEIFKEQIKESSKLMDFFYGKNETELKKELEINKFIHMNTMLMVDTYAEQFLVQRESDNSIYKNSVTRYNEKYNMDIVDFISKQIEKDVKKENNEHYWETYQHMFISVPIKLEQKEFELQALLTNPLLPTKFLESLQEFNDVLKENLKIIINEIEECSKEMLVQHPEGLDREVLFWIHHRVDTKLISFEESALKIIREIRDYYNVDLILADKKERKKLNRKT